MSYTEDQDAHTVIKAELQAERMHTIVSHISLCVCVSGYTELPKALLVSSRNSQFSGMEDKQKNKHVNEIHGRIKGGTECLNLRKRSLIPLG